jgi:TM2 domain-containing membrane protein YozV
MTTENRQEKPVAAYCRVCGAALAEDEVRWARGTIYCQAHLPPPEPEAAAQTAAPPLAPNPGVSPGLAFFLGMIPGVGAIYNGQYAKGIIHVVILGLLLSISSSDAAGGLEPLFGMLTAVFWFYMAFEAYHTARRRMLGEPVEEFSSLLDVRSGARSPLVPLLLIVLGGLFLLNNLGVLPMREVLRFWPVLLIAAGVWMLMEQVRGGSRNGNSGGGQ